MIPPITGMTLVAGVAGAPVAHSLSPILHNAWLEAAGIDGVYVAFSPLAGHFAEFVQGLRGGAIRGLNVTVPFKLAALAAADRRTARAEAAGAANLLVFERDGAVLADNTDGEGLLAAFAEQAPSFDPVAGPVVILGAGGAARGAAAAILAAGAPEVRIANRSVDKAAELARTLGPRAQVVEARDALGDAIALVNATTLGLNGAAGPSIDLRELPETAVVMDMVYRPLETELLALARARGFRAVDGLAMLIGQARPSFAALFGRPPPDHLDVRALALRALEDRS